MASGHDETEDCLLRVMALKGIRFSRPVATERVQDEFYSLVESLLIQAE